MGWRCGPAGEYLPSMGLGCGPAGEFLPSMSEGMGVLSVWLYFLQSLAKETGEQSIRDTQLKLTLTLMNQC